MTPLLKKLRWALAVVAVSAGVLSLGLVHRGSAKPVPDGGRWVAVEAEEPRFELAVTGRLAPARLVEIASPATGTLNEVALTFGATVMQGQRVLRVASPELDTQLRTAEAAWLRSQLDAHLNPGQEPADLLAARRRVLSAQSALHSASSRANDAETLFSRGFVSRLDRDGSAAERDNARAQLDAAEDDLRTVMLKYSAPQRRAQALESAGKQAELDQLRQRRQQLEVVAPISGVLLPPAAREGGQQPALRDLVQGGRVNAGDTLLAIGDTSSFVVQAACSENDMAWLEPGLVGRVEVAALPGRSFQARLSRLAASVRTQQSGLGQGGPEFDCEFAFPLAGEALSEDDRRRLRIGGSAAVRLSHVARTSQTKVPLAALAWGADGRAQLRWRPAAGAAEEMRAVQVSAVGVDEVQLRDAFQGEVWVGRASANSAGAIKAGMPPGSPADEPVPERGRLSTLLSRMLGGEP